MNTTCETCWYWVQTDSETDGVCTCVESEMFGEETSHQLTCDQQRPVKQEREP